jgi:molybdopterin-guanine dinucleotide biosynthesis protein A
VLGLVGAIARKVYLRSADGESDPPEWPSAAETLQEGKRFLLDHLAVYGAFVAPAMVALMLGVPSRSMLPALLLGMFLAPMALILRQHRGDVSALSPVTIVRGISSSRGYLRIAGLYWLAFLPAAIAFLASLGNAPWIQLAIVGPLSVLPAFGTARVLGTFVDAHRERLGVLIQLAATPRGVAQAPQHKPMRGARPVGVAPTAQAKPQAAAQPRAVRPTTAAQPAPKPSVPTARIEGRAPKPAQARPQTAKPTAGKPTAAKVGTQPAARSAQQKQPAQQQPAAAGFAGPDLSGIPGATVISGADRIVLSGGPAPDAVWEVVADSAHYSGPVAGLHSLLLVATQEKFDVLIVQPIDMPMLQPDQLRLMRDHVSRVEGIVVAESQLSKDRHWVLAGVHCSQYQEVIAHIESGTGGSLKNLWSACACEFINFPDEFLVNVNYPLITDER